MRNKTTIFPYYKNCYEIVYYFTKYTSKYNIKHAISPKGFKLAGKDAGFIENKEELGILIEEDIDMAISQSNILIITPISNLYNYREYVLDIIKKSIKAKKEIVCVMRLNESELIRFNEMSNAYQINFTYVNPIINKICNSWMTPKKTNVIPKKLYRPEIPVVFIGETFPSSISLKVMLDLKYSLKALGYSVLGITSCICGKLLGFESNIAFLDINLNPAEKCISFNHFIQNICMDNRVDILIIQIPGPVIVYDDYIVNSFGIETFMMSQVLQQDFFVLCDSFQGVEEEYYIKISKYLKEKFGFYIDVVSMTNGMLDYKITKDINELSIRNVSNAYIDEATAAFSHKKIPLINAMNNEAGRLISELMLRKLA